LKRASEDAEKKGVGKHAEGGKQDPFGKGGK